jgi:hypothetical protein
MSLEAWKAFFEIGGVVLLAATFVFGAGALIVNNRINLVASKELVDFKLRFEGEQQKTAHAQQEAAEAKALAGGFERDIAVANQKSGEANERAAHLEVEAAGQRQRAAEAEAKLIELQRTLADRSLTDSQAESILDKIKLFAGQEYAITAYWDSKESLGIANRINAILELAGWRYNPVGSKSFMLGGIVGIQVWTHPDASESTKQSAAALISALSNEGLAAEGRTQNPQNPRTDMINVNIGSKR